MASETHSEVGHAEHGAESGLFPPFDPSTFGSQLLWLAITFGILYYMMSKVILPRIGSILETRSDRIEQDMAEAQRLKEETDEAIAAYEQSLSDARGKAHGIAQAAREKSKAASDKAMAKVEADVATKLEKAEEQISAIRATAMSEVNDIASDAAETVVKTLIGGRVTKTEIKKALQSVVE